MMNTSSAIVVLQMVVQVSAATALIDITKEHQVIRGFGTCSAWNGYVDSITEAPLLWSTASGAGLSLHRLMIPPEGVFDQYELANAKVATGYGVTIWGTPWFSKYGKDVIHGADTMDYDTLYEADMQNWADDLADLAISMKNAGTPLYTISPQNEADLGWTKFDAKAGALWVGKYLGPTLSKRIPDLKVMGTETCNWWGFSSYYDVFKKDTDAWNVTDIFATHEYGGTVRDYPDIRAAGKEFWQTEIYDTQTDFEDLGMGSALRVTKLIHEALTIANMNAWHFWWIKPCKNCANGALWGENPYKASKRLWIMGNWSRFVRPGSKRINAPVEPTTGVYLTAFRDSLQRKLVLVAVNNNSNPITQDFSFPGITAIQAIAYITDPTRDIQMQEAKELKGSSYSYELPAQSVTTLVFELEAKVPSVSLYKNYNYNTLVAQLPIGTYTKQELIGNGVQDNDISSLKIPEGITIDLYDGDHFENPLGSYTGENLEKLGDQGINDAITSIKISEAVSSIRFGGLSGELNAYWSLGRFYVTNSSIARLQVIDMNGKIQSLKVENGKVEQKAFSPGNYLVKAFSDKNGQVGFQKLVRVNY